MKIVFVHDHKFCRDENGTYYSDGQFPYELWLRYLQYFDKIVVMGRVRSLREEESWEMLDRSSGPKVEFVEIPVPLHPGARLLSSIQVKKRMEDTILHADGVIVRNGELAVLAAAVARRLQKVWAVEVVSSAFDGFWHHGSLLGKLYAPWAEFAMRRMVRKAPFALYVTQQFLQKRYPCSGKTAACSDVQLDFSTLVDKQARQQRELLGERVLRIGMIGSLVPAYKGLKTAFAALRRLKEQGFYFEFHILGGGDLEPWKVLALKEGVVQETYFDGVLPKKAVGSWLDQVDIYIQPSLTEGLPRGLLEAMSRGCPAIASRVGGIPELLGNSCLHRPGDAEGLARLLKQALLEPAWREVQGQRNLAVAAEHAEAKMAVIRGAFWQEFRKACERRR